MLYDKNFPEGAVITDVAIGVQIAQAMLTPVRRIDYPALCPGWMPTIKTKPKCGNGLSKRYFGAKKDGSHGESKRGWAPNVIRPNKTPT